MIKLSRMTDYAVVVLSQLATCNRSVQTVPRLADMTGLGEATVAKVLKTLVPAGLVVSQRGANGGYALARPAQAITVAEIVVALEGPIALASCVTAGDGLCSVEDLCPIRGNWDPVNEVITSALESVSLAEIIVPAAGAGFAQRGQGTPVPKASRAPAASELV